MKIFISQVMRDKSQTDILSEWAAIQDQVEQLFGNDVEFVDSYFPDYSPNTGCVPLKYLAKELELLADADIVVMGKGWEHARGCVIEHKCAVEYGLTIVYM